ncbi:hypothetical protein BJ546DRAFT_993427 [Cryomyces antarcticus]
MEATDYQRRVYRDVGQSGMSRKSEPASGHDRNDSRHTLIYNPRAETFTQGIGPCTLNRLDASTQGTKHRNVSGWSSLEGIQSGESSKSTIMGYYESSQHQQVLVDSSNPSPNGSTSHGTPKPSGASSCDVVSWLKEVQKSISHTVEETVSEGSSLYGISDSENAGDNGSVRQAAWNHTEHASVDTPAIVSEDGFHSAREVATPHTPYCQLDGSVQYWESGRSAYYWAFPDNINYHDTTLGHQTVPDSGETPPRGMPFNTNGGNANSTPTVDSSVGNDYHIRNSPSFMMRPEEVQNARLAKLEYGPDFVDRKVDAAPPPEVKALAPQSWLRSSIIYLLERLRLPVDPKVNRRDRTREPRLKPRECSEPTCHHPKPHYLPGILQGISMVSLLSRWESSHEEVLERLDPLQTEAEVGRSKHPKDTISLSEDQVALPSEGKSHRDGTVSMPERCFSIDAGIVFAGNEDHTAEPRRSGAVVVSSTEGANPFQIVPDYTDEQLAEIAMRGLEFPEEDKEMLANQDGETN